jgi:hypothetical protein
METEMISRVRLYLATLGVGLLTLVSLSPLAATAASSNANGPGNGLRVSPVRSDITIKPGETQTITINVTNVTSRPGTYQAIINDFTANSNETGQPAIILDPTKYAASHSLKRFIKPISNFSLAPGQQTGVAVTVSVPSNAAGGGYFGAVRFAPASAGATNQTVSLAGSVGSLILAKVPGDIHENLSIFAVVRFQNSGNIQEEPFGKILLKNHSGKVLASYEVNNTTPAGNVLPDSIRKFPVALGDKVGGIGQYKLEGNFGYGSGGQLLSASTTFYVIPMWLIVAFLALVLLIVFLIFGLPRLVRAYNRRVLRKARSR